MGHPLRLLTTLGAGLLLAGGLWAASGGPNMPGMDMSGAATAPRPWWSMWQFAALLAVIVIALLLWGLHRVTRSRYLNPGIIGGVAFLIGAYLLTALVVAHFRKPGQTPLLEASTMDMSAMKAPEGTVPVATEIAQPRGFAAGVSYTGTVVAYNDEDVYPRVPGTIAALPVYPGDNVTAGQLLVKLDDVEYSAREREAVWDREMAARAQTTSERERDMASASRRQAEAEVSKSQQDLKVMQHDVTAAQAMAKQSEREVEQAEHNVQAGENEVEAAQAEQEQAQAEASMAAAGIEAAQADVASAQADLAYWQEEIKRAKKLLDVGAYSTDDYQRELSQFKAAQAKLAQAQAMVSEKKQALTKAQAATKQATAAVAGAQARLAAMQSEVGKAQAGLEKARADVATAEAKVESGGAEVRSAQAMREERTAGVQASAARVSEASAAVPQRAAALTAARTVRGYTEIRATQSGSVIQRLVSPGVLVQPGTAILRLAQLDRVRLQAYVSQRDLTLLSVGGRVEARSPKLPGGMLIARITSIFPAADPTTRTSVVEAIVDNRDRQLYPGDAVGLKLLAQEHRSALTVPSTAIVTRTVATGGPSSRQEATVWLATGGSAVGGASAGKTIYTCVMHPEVRQDHPGKCPKCGMDLVPEKAAAGGSVKKAHQILVSLGATDGERTEVVLGLQAGDEVIVRGMQSLHEGDPVYAVPWSTAGPVNMPPAPGATTGGASSAPAPPGGARSGMKM